MSQQIECRYCGSTHELQEQLTKHLAEQHDPDDLSRIDRRRVEQYAQAPSPVISELSTRLSRRSVLGMVGVGLTLPALGSALVSGSSSDGLRVDNTLADNLNPEDLAERLVEGTDIDIVDGSVEYTGADEAAGTFEGRIQASGNVTPDGDERTEFGFDDGIILSTGEVEDVEGPNENDMSTGFGREGDADLERLDGVGNTNDAAVLEFEFNVPDGTDTIGFNYLFGSIEYNQFVYSFNDVFAFFVNGTAPDDNVAIVPDPDQAGETAPAAIDNINHGNDPNDPRNPDLFVNNDPRNGNLVTIDDPENPPGPGIGFDVEAATGEGDEPYDTEMDGFTVELGFDVEVDPDDNPQEIKIAIADEVDAFLDTAVLIEGGSLETDPDDPLDDPSPAAIRVEGDNVTISNSSIRVGDDED